MKYFKKIEGERIYLSPINLEDAEVYTKWMNDPSITNNTHASARLMNVEAEKEWIQSSLCNQDYQFAIVLKENDTLLGNCGIMNLNSIDQVATVGIFIGEEEYRSNGYGAEALRLLLSYGFDVLHLHNMDLKVFSFNTRAIRCYEKVGFREYGRRHESYYLNGSYHDQIMMEILEKDWRDKK